MMVRALWAGLALIALLTGSVHAQTANTGIVAGQHVGGVRIGASIDEAISAWGSFYDREDTPSGKFVEYGWPLRPFAAIAEKESGRIVAIFVQLSDVYRTDRGGITGGSERSAVEAAYGSEFAATEGQEAVTLTYDALGIGFLLPKFGSLSSRVAWIIIFAPGQWKAITDGL